MLVSSVSSGNGIHVFDVGHHCYCCADCKWARKASPVEMIESTHGGRIYVS